MVITGIVNLQQKMYEFILAKNCSIFKYDHKKGGVENAPLCIYAYMQA
jgi:hypothetical protein